MLSLYAVKCWTHQYGDLSDPTGRTITVYVAGAPDGDTAEDAVRAYFYPLEDKRLASGRHIGAVVSRQARPVKSAPRGKLFIHAPTTGAEPERGGLRP